MKRLAVSMMVPALAIFMVVVMASAQDTGWGAIHGTYELIATGNCMHSTTDFGFSGAGTAGSPYTANPGPTHYISTYFGEGTWVFQSDGSGTMEVTQSCILPDQAQQKLIPSAPLTMETIPFTYQFLDDKRIKVTIGFPVYLELFGRVSRDHKTMTLNSTMQKQVVAGAYPYQVCNIGRVLIRVEE